MTKTKIFKGEHGGWIWACHCGEFNSRKGAGLDLMTYRECRAEYEEHFAEKCTECKRHSTHKMDCTKGRRYGRLR